MLALSPSGLGSVTSIPPPSKTQPPPTTGMDVDSHPSFAGGGDGAALAAGGSRRWLERTKRVRA